MTKVIVPANLVSQFDISTPLIIDNCSTVADALEKIVQDYSGMKEYLYSDSGSLRRFLNLFVDGEDIRFLDGIKTSLDNVEELSILMAVAGG